MPVSPSSSAQSAREGVARHLRELRQDAGLTLVELASLCGWSHSKISRIENAKTPPAATDIVAWCRHSGAAGRIDDLVALSRDAETMYQEWRRKARTGLRQLQDSYLQLFASTQLFRVYSPTVIPGLLQTEGYTRALLSGNARLLGIADDSAEAAVARAERSQIIHRAGHRFVFVIEEGALRLQLGDSDDMAAQLGHLLTAGALPAVSLGIIPMATPARRLWPQEVFHLYDNTLASVELLSAQVNITQPSEIQLYEAAFEELRSMAVYGPAARSLIVDAIEALPDVQSSGAA
ncbi:helix-turn-helix transcriptional regulator [Streptomyces sp. WAC01280]|uniref:helix-turn-helix domain-containing protein n=1 Tax=Streptomyces sp. WAC01280 TaxID=2487424 RepID=UPI000F79A10C|nr:helix-turn-helix transcriptional regulator [Streptomyces sp. WAC01280]RSS59588.1 XRE family transcriptional regulator [Streptomyces sp. WAC01280]